VKAIKIVVGAILASILLGAKNASKRRRPREERDVRQQGVAVDLFGLPYQPTSMFGTIAMIENERVIKDASGPVRPQDVRAEVVDGSPAFGVKDIATVEDRS
jgi:hypothetical protein